jgi:hypothetical protein
VILHINDDPDPLDVNDDPDPLLINDESEVVPRIDVMVRPA